MSTLALEVCKFTLPLHPALSLIPAGSLLISGSHHALCFRPGSVLPIYV